MLKLFFYGFYVCFFAASRLSKNNRKVSSFNPFMFALGRAIIYSMSGCLKGDFNSFDTHTHTRTPWLYQYANSTRCSSIDSGNVVFYCSTLSLMDSLLSSFHSLSSQFSSLSTFPCFFPLSKTSLDHHRDVNWIAVEWLLFMRISTILQ